jgi:hypothetical protein
MDILPIIKDCLRVDVDGGEEDNGYFADNQR